MPAQDPFPLRLVPYRETRRKANFQLLDLFCRNGKEIKSQTTLEHHSRYAVYTIERLPNLDFRGLVRRQLVLQGVPSPTKQLPVQSVAGPRVADLF